MFIPVCLGICPDIAGGDHQQIFTLSPFRCPNSTKKPVAGHPRWISGICEKSLQLIIDRSFKS